MPAAFEAAYPKSQAWKYFHSWDVEQVYIELRANLHSSLKAVDFIGVLMPGTKSA